MKTLEEYRVDFIDVIKRQLGAAIRSKGGTVNDTDSWDIIVSALNALPKKNIATGTAYVIPRNPFSVNTLSFTPNFILIRGSNGTPFFEKSYWAQQSNMNTFTLGQNNSFVAFKQDTGDFTITPNGFSVTTLASDANTLNAYGNIYWIAAEI